MSAPRASQGSTDAGGGKQLLEVAAEHATTRVPTAKPGQTAGEVRDAIIGSRFESAVDVAVLDGESLVGIVSIEALLAADRRARIESVMDADPPIVEPGADQEVAAWVMCRRGEASIAVPWLLLGLVGAMASALLVGAFEEQLDKKVLLAFFVPAVVYMADAVGTQTETVLIRELSVGVTVREIALRELLTGAIIGAVVGAAFVPFALVGWGDGGVAAAVALALFASCSIATLAT
jgi:magnesium transporter